MDNQSGAEGLEAWRRLNRAEFFERRQRRVQVFINYVDKNAYIQFALKRIRTVDELIDLSKRHRVPLDHVDVVCFYTEWNQPYWPWYGKPLEVRRHFAHLGVMPEVDPPDDSPVNPDPSCGA